MSLSVWELGFFRLVPALAADDFFVEDGGALVGLGLGGADLVVGVADLVGAVDLVVGGADFVGGVENLPEECLASRSTLQRVTERKTHHTYLHAHTM